MRYIKGIKNYANILSRYPVSEPDKEDIAITERCNGVMFTSINKTTEIVAITTEKIKGDAQSDSQYKLYTKLFCIHIKEVHLCWPGQDNQYTGQVWIVTSITTVSHAFSAERWHHQSQKSH